MDEISYLFLFFKVAIFFAMMWALSALIPIITKEYRDNKMPMLAIIKNNKKLSFINFLLVLSVIILSFY